MNTGDAENLARHLMRFHCLTGIGILSSWQFRWDNARRRCGQCCYSSRTISLSRHYAEMNSEDQVRNTILHEIAHALVGPGHGHDEVWQAKAEEIGAKPIRVNVEAEMPAGRWQAVCKCERVHHYHRRPRSVRLCRHCEEELQFREV